MAPLESLPPDQRAVLQLVLQRGRSYDEIAAMLSIDRAAVRDRALSAFDTIGPPTRVTADRRALITDYLMGQLPPRVAEQIFERLKSAPAERAWARALASDLSTLSRGPLPEIPSSVESTAPSPSAPRTPPAPMPPAAPTPQPVPEAARRGPEASEPADEPAQAPEEPEAQDTEPVSTPRPRRSRPAAEQGTPSRVKPAFSEEDEDDAGYGRRDDTGAAGPPSDRRGGAILIGIGVLVAAAVIVVAIILTNNGGSSKSPGTIAQTPPTTSAPATTSPSTATAGATTPTGTSSTSAGAATTPATGTGTTATGTSGATGSTGTQVVAQFDLKAPGGGSSAKGVAQIVKQGSEEGIVLAATGVPANTTHPANAYAVWLYSSPTKAHLLGFVNPAVKSNGEIKTAALLPANVASYGQVLVTLETQSKPKAPGTIVLRGTLSLH